MIEPSLSLIIATWFQPDMVRCVSSWRHPSYIVPFYSIIDAYEIGFRACQSDILGYVHDDVIVHSPEWRCRVIEEFDDPEVALVGFAGATGHCQSFLYARPFYIPNMVRIDFRSNLLDAEKHGTRLLGSMNAAVLDGLAFFVRRSFLEGVGGWPLGTPCNYFMYMEWLSCMVRRYGKKIRVVGVPCQHLGGKSSGLNSSFHPDYEGEHRYIYEEFRDVLPARVEP